MMEFQLSHSKPLGTIQSKCCTQYVSLSGRSSSGHSAGQGQSSSQFPKMVKLKNLLTMGQLDSSPMLLRSCLKSFMLGFSITNTKSLQTFKLDLEKSQEPEVKLATYSGSQRKENSEKNIYLCFINYAKAFEWIVTNCGKPLKRWEYQTI